ncbi:MULTISPECIES: DUF4810 domain-containing protein [Pseudomonas]|jgi:hypothetical protein|uniref:DUF4810 domain-containing protein n=3 Tax=Pseudomonas chlororaphis TaxID=587753 RepID=A0AAP9VQK6_9PSED|nr:lipoprotein [Pseudomonas chlororaphis]AZD87096.1 putative lipoprotein [Pseudomonas chlororaphis subsp. aureofaciens]EIM18333.1 putative lipoprotein [Pseudomonas chlororaphis O6]POA68359.1 DUF4810 domain-containing protein [Pseudomonas sp. GW531-T4]TSD26951.1 DUF4810 domain-containing protein [Pseudomonas sp. ATCC 13985]
MFNTKMARPLMAAMLLGSVLLAGCSGPKTLYQWETYQAQTYEYFKGEEAKEAQVEALERDLQKIKSTGKAVPPGYHAHLGMLYAGLGKDDQMVQQFNTEKALFPESAPYMDFLLKNAKKGAGQ